MDPLSDTWLEYLRAEGVEASEACRRAFAEYPGDTARHHPFTPTHTWES